jgi:hypothetical protein
MTPGEEIGASRRARYDGPVSGKVIRLEEITGDLTTHRWKRCLGLQESGA